MAAVYARCFKTPHMCQSESSDCPSLIHHSILAPTSPADASLAFEKTALKNHVRIGDDQAPKYMCSEGILVHCLILRGPLAPCEIQPDLILVSPGSIGPKGYVNRLLRPNFQSFRRDFEAAHFAIICSRPLHTCHGSLSCHSYAITVTYDS